MMSPGARPVLYAGYSKFIHHVHLFMLEHCTVFNNPLTTSVVSMKVGVHFWSGIFCVVGVPYFEKDLEPSLLFLSFIFVPLSSWIM